MENQQEASEPKSDQATLAEGQSLINQQDLEKLAEQLQEERLLNIVIVDLNKREIQLKMVQYEMVLELREFLNEHVYTCFFTHYYFEHQGKRLNDYTELAELNFQEDQKIFMRPEKYDEKNARQHIRRVKEILTSPPVLSSQTEPPQQQHKIQQPHQLQKPDQQPDEVAKVEEQPEKKQQNEYEDKLKKNYDDFMAIIDRESKKEIPMPQKNGHTLLRDLFKNPIETEMNKVSFVKCIETIQYSTFNPVPPYRRLVGDLFYLTVKTLDTGDHGITCSVNGFFRNDNIEKQQFAPGPSTKQSPCYSYTLVGCLHQLSPAFGRNLEQYINSILATEPYFLTQPSLPVHSWITQEEKLINQRLSQMNKEEPTNLIPLYGLDPKGIRDWNEEYQVVKDFAKESFIQRVQRDRAIQKVYNDFLDAAIKGATAVVNGNLMPLNPNETEKQQVFVYNYIFFSYAIDLIDSFRDLTSTENNPSFTQANHDILGLRALQILDVEGLHLLATCIVNYKGHRVIAQSIIPGILNNNDLTSLAEYGSVDEQKTIYASESFHILMKKVCEQMKIKVTKVIDGSGKEVEIAGSVEVKGIKGTDKRNYLVDLQGMTPRDHNYLGEEFHTCLLRPELLLIYQRTKNIEYATGKMAEFNKKMEEEKGKEEQKKYEEMTEQEREELAAKKTDENLRKLKEFDNYLKEAPKFIYNTNVFKNIKFAVEETEVTQDEDLVKELAKFLNEQAIQKLIKDLQNIEGVPTDSESLEQAFHSHGVNMRYLGTVSKELNEKELNHLKTMLEREVVFRSAKHIFNEHLRDCSDTYLSSVISHLFNILLAPFPFIEQLNEGKIEYIDQTIQAQVKEAQDKQEVEEKQQRSKDGQPLEDSDQQKEDSAKQQQLSKNEKKKLKKKSKQQPKPEQQNQEPAKHAEPADLSDMLFKQNQDIQNFSIDDLFKEKSVALGIIEIQRPEALRLKPIDLYARIRVIAAQRYGMNLPEKQTDLKCLQNQNNKISLLRDICLKVGVQILSHQHKDYILENDIQLIQNRISQQVSNENQRLKSSSGKKKTQQQAVPQSAEQLMQYQYLPFQLNDFVEIYPVIKHLELQNNDVRQMLQQAKQVYKEGYFEKAFELYSQCINTLLQITGPMNKEVAACISKLASIQFKFGDFLQAIELQTKSIILQERILGYDHPQTAYSYSNLALYYHTCGYFSKAFEYMYRAVNILKVSSGENHPDIASIYLNLGLMYQDFEHFQAAIDCFLESLYRNINLFGENHIQVSSCYQAIAHAYFQLNDYRKALDFQEKAHKILIQIFPLDDQYVKNSQAQMDQFMKLSVYVEKFKTQEKTARPIGSNKANQQNQAKTKQGQAQAQTEAIAEAGKRNMKTGQLFSRLQNQRSKGYNFLDLLEYNYIREQQLQRVMKDQIDPTEGNEQPKQSESEEKK